MQKTDLEKMVARHEGYMPHVYRCTAGKLTIGYGYNLQAGMPEDEAHLLMRHRLNKIDGELDGRLLWYDSLPAAIKNVLQDMAYQMGVAGLLQFKKFLAALEAGMVEQAAKEMLDSKWARTDSPGRARELAGIIRGTLLYAAPSF